MSGAGPNRYDQAAAVRDYLQTHYTYSLSHTRVPRAGEDLTDQFLFQQKTGYCVHFSTAMTVMLRSQGIPARWVKGYLPGTPMEGGNASGQMVQVTEADAHAWVEVYLAGAGWVPFDPTPGIAGSGADGSVGRAQAQRSGSAAGCRAALIGGSLAARSAERDRRSRLGRAFRRRAPPQARSAASPCSPATPRRSPRWPLRRARWRSRRCASGCASRWRCAATRAPAPRRAPGAAARRRRSGGALRRRPRGRRAAPREALLAAAAQLQRALERRHGRRRGHRERARRSARSGAGAADRRRAAKARGLGGWRALRGPAAWHGRAAGAAVAACAASGATTTFAAGSQVRRLGRIPMDPLFELGS